MAKVNGKHVPDYAYIKQLLPEVDEEEEDEKDTDSESDTTLKKMDTTTSQDQMDFV